MLNLITAIRSILTLTCVCDDIMGSAVCGDVPEPFRPPQDLCLHCSMFVATNGCFSGFCTFLYVFHVTFESTDHQMLSWLISLMGNTFP